MSCKDCGNPIDKHQAEQAARLAAHFSPGQPIRMPTLCTECHWKRIERFGKPPPQSGKDPAP